MQRVIILRLFKPLETENMPNQRIGVGSCILYRRPKSPKTAYRLFPSGKIEACAWEFFPQLCILGSWGLSSFFYIYAMTCHTYRPNWKRLLVRKRKDENVSEGERGNILCRQRPATAILKTEVRLDSVRLDIPPTLRSNTVCYSHCSGSDETNRRRPFSVVYGYRIWVESSRDLDLADGNRLQDLTRGTEAKDTMSPTYTHRIRS